ncbi:helix-turn-helix domain-containing protein [Agrilactobacillus yilanensis]|uniref:Helix-turn-helix domain-containing protein n=1 Tax=Agrilactobacillus yilanensis TaxID=2485997 RepID=A0ABW4J3W8_9LACO|nr:helix-turn-helix domain-containing protein [Agrilactobacillus yilanensis]
MRKLQNFENEYLLVLPGPILENYIFSPIISNLYVTDLGFYPNAQYHYVQREKGTAEWILIFCINGSGTITYKGKDWAMHHNCLAILPPDQAHTYYAAAEDPWDIYWVHFRGRLAADYLPMAADDFYYTDQINELQADKFMVLFTDMIQTFLPGFSYERTFLVSQYLGVLLARITTQIGNATPSFSGNQYVSEAIQYIYDHSNQVIKMSEITDHIGISVSYLSRIFKETIGKSVNQFITDLKIKQACHYLEYTDLSIQAVAHQVGYTDSYYFSRIFKKNMQVSPKLFRSGKTPTASHLDISSK